jgi:SAM-dependent methyltransferase
VKRLLNVGGNNKAIALPPQYAGFEHLLLDIDPRLAPDILCDARELATLAGGQFDAIYCSHNLEHYYRHDVPKVLAGFLHVLKEGGFADIRVPDIGELMRVSVARGLDIEDVVYQSDGGPIIGLDMLYGYGAEIERSGQDFFAHKTGFTEKSLLGLLHRAGFTEVFSNAGGFDLGALAFKGTPDAAARALFGL